MYHNTQVLLWVNMKHEMHLLQTDKGKSETYDKREYLQANVGQSI